MLGRCRDYRSRRTSRRRSAVRAKPSSEESGRGLGIIRFGRPGSRSTCAMAADASARSKWPRTTALYDRRDDEVAVGEVERILI
jgi:hypothetical protein